uniref:Uncharacterized protein n=1 Tax=Aegilops tauschii subsp. strangulata TaxID=200361 RepID=A0A453JVE5_AEGTS
SDAKPITLTIEDQDYMGDIEMLKLYLDKGEDDREARLLEGHPQSGNKLDDLSDTCADSDVP